MAIAFYLLHNKTPKVSHICPLNNENIVTLGDSIANGFGVNKKDSFAIQIPQSLGKNPIKLGIDGETTSGLLARIDNELNKINSIAMIIISIGGNDFLRKLPEDSTKRNLDAIISKAKKHTNCIVIISVPSGILGGLTGGISSIYNEVAKKYNILVESRSMPKILKDISLKLDQIHPNKEGHNLITNNVLDLVNKHK